MSLFISLSLRAAMLNGLETFMLVGGGTAVLRVLQASTTLVDFSLTAAPFGAANAGSIVIASAPITAVAAASGNATRFQLLNKATTVGLSGTVGADRESSLVTPSLVVTAITIQRLNALTLRMDNDGVLFLEGSLTLQ